MYYFIISYYALKRYIFTKCLLLNGNFLCQLHCCGFCFLVKLLFHTISICCECLDFLASVTTNSNDKHDVQLYIQISGPQTKRVGHFVNFSWCTRYNTGLLWCGGVPQRLVLEPLLCSTYMYSDIICEHNSNHVKMMILKCLLLCRWHSNISVKPQDFGPVSMLPLLCL